jgi:hypothetical protein
MLLYWFKVSIRGPNIYDRRHKRTSSQDIQFDFRCIVIQEVCSDFRCIVIQVCSVIIYSLFLFLIIKRLNF